MNWNYLYITLRSLFVLLIIAASCLAIYYVAKVTLPFIIAIIFAFLMNPLVNLLNRRFGIPRGLSVLIALIIIFGMIAGLVTLLVIEMIAGFTYLTEVVPEKINWFINFFENFFATTLLPIYHQLMDIFNNLGTDQQNTITQSIQKIGTNLTGVLKDLGEAIVNGLSSFILALPNFVTVLIFALLGTFFISKDWYKFGRRLKQMIPDRVSEGVGSVYADLKKALLGFLKAQLTLISITAVISLIGLLILRVEYAFTIAVVTGIVDLMPYLGTGAVFVPWIIYMFFTGNYYLTIGLSILYGIIITQRQVMEPKVISSSIGLDPLATLVALFVGFQLFGFLGLIIGPVVLVILKTLHEANVFRDLWKYILGKPV
ncbi:MAG TPA: sporulation integral membrane protein YtvI [Bacillales bacterium]